jgi:hypothetical protein
MLGAQVDVSPLHESLARLRKAAAGVTAEIEVRDRGRSTG